MVHGICINGIKKEIAFIRHEDAQAFPAACCSVKLLCADVFHDMEIRYSRYLRFESLCGSQGARESREPDAGTETEVPGGASSGGLWSSGFGLSELSGVLPRKEVIQPHLPVRLPCYDFTPLTLHTFDASAPRGVRPAASGADDSGGVTGGVYKARERIHRGVLIRDY